MFVSILPTFKGGSAAISKELGGHMDTAGVEGGKRYGAGMSTGLAGMAKGIFAPLVAAVAGIGVFQFFKDAIGGASDLNETVSKSNIIFGENAGAVTKWASGAAKNMGLSKAAALDSAAGFGNMFTQLGFAGGAAAKLSTGVVQMAADLGSFNNLPTAAVADMMSGAFRGEYDSLQRLVPNINAARVEQEALAATGKTSVDQLTAQDKATAVLAIVQKDGALAMGDYAKTADGAANRQKTLAAQTEDLKAKVGAGLLPAWTGLLTFMSDTMIPAFYAAGSVISTVAGFVMQNKEAFIALGVVIAVITALTIAHAAVLAVAAAGGLAAYIASIGIVQVATSVWTAVQWALSAALTANPIGIIVMAIAALVAGIVWVATQTTWFQTIWEYAWGAIKTAALFVWDFIKLWFSWSPIGLVIQNWGAITGWFGDMWAKITGFFSTAWGFIKQVFSYTPLGIVIENFGAIVSFFTGIPGKITGAIGNLGSLLYNSGRDLIQGLLDGAGSLLTKMGTFFLDKVPAFIREPFKRALGIASPSRVFAGYGVNLGQGLIQGVDSMESQINASMSAMVALPSVPNLNANVRGVQNASSGNAGAGAPQITQNVYPTPGLSEQQVGIFAASQLQWAMRGQLA